MRQALVVQLVQQPQDGSADTAVRLALAPSYVTYLPPAIDRVADFFRTEQARAVNGELLLARMCLSLAGRGREASAVLRRAGAGLRVQSVACRLDRERGKAREGECGSGVRCWPLRPAEAAAAGPLQVVDWLKEQSQVMKMTRKDELVAGARALLTRRPRGRRRWWTCRRWAPRRRRA